MSTYVKRENNVKNKKKKLKYYYIYMVKVYSFYTI